MEQQNLKFIGFATLAWYGLGFFLLGIPGAIVYEQTKPFLYMVHGRHIIESSEVRLNEWPISIVMWLLFPVFIPLVAVFHKINKEYINLSDNIFYLISGLIMIIWAHLCSLLIVSNFIP